MQRFKSHVLTVIFFVFSVLASTITASPQVSGTLAPWQAITLLFDGPKCGETSSPNPFSDYRLTVSFIKDTVQLVVPGHFAADGNAAFTSATKGNKWRVYFLPPSAGKWNYSVSFRKGKDIAVKDETGESAEYMDGFSGTLKIKSTRKGANALGKLRYVGTHYLQFAESKTYFLKAGVDAPENLLAYDDFDATPNVGNRRKSWTPHKQDYNADADAYLWGADRSKGKNLLGAIHYLSVKGLNAFSFLTFNVDGDDRNVFPHLLKVDEASYEKEANIKDTNHLWEIYVEHDRFDVSKMDQWEQLFSYGDSKGMFLHFKTQETENNHKMDGGELGRERKLYYRELISRYGHHLAINWNLGEENTQSTGQVQQMASYFHTNDPYQSPIVLHTYPNQHEKVYRPLLGQQSDLQGISIQTKNSDFSLVHGAVHKWVKASKNAGKPWVVAVDEPGDASHALLPDSEDSLHNNARINGLWGTLLAGGYGTEWYFGYKHAHSDLSCEDWRSRDLFWNQCKVALEFFNNHPLPLTEMQSMDTLTSNPNDFVYAKPGEVYLIYSTDGAPIDFEIPAKGFEMTWFNPRSGEYLPVKNTATSSKEIVCPTQQDWLLYLYRP